MRQAEFKKLSQKEREEFVEAQSLDVIIQHLKTRYGFKHLIKITMLDESRTEVTFLMPLNSKQVIETIKNRK